MTSIAYDLNYLQAGISAMEEYLLSSELYWPISARPPSGEPPYPKLTLGGLLLALARVKARTKVSSEITRLERLDENINTVRDRWLEAWKAKAGREFTARLRLWSDFLDEYLCEPENQVDRYAYEVQRRVMLDLLSPEREEKPEESIKLHELDAMLKSVFIRGKFLWEAELVPGFPENSFWYLWGEPRN